MIYINVFLVILNVIIFVVAAVALGRHEYQLSKKVNARLEEYKKQTKEMRNTIEKEIDASVRDKLKLIVGETVENKMRTEIFNILEKAFDGILSHHLWKAEDNVIRRSITNLMIEEIIKVKNKELNK